MRTPMLEPLLALFVIVLCYLVPLLLATPLAHAAPTLQGQLNINTASEHELMQLPGCGQVCAQRIIRFRERDPFRSIRQLLRIRGIGRKRYQRLKTLVKIDGESDLRQVHEPPDD